MANAPLSRGYQKSPQMQDRQRSSLYPRAAEALSRFTVLDLTRVRSGPTAVRQLADWGANVIKIEIPEGVESGDPPGGPRHGPDFQNLHRNKRGITLNLKDPRGQAEVLKIRPVS